MYDNVNNNQNFNNGNNNGMVRPLFENDFKTVQENNGVEQPGFNGNLGYQPQMNQPSFGYPNQPVNAFENSFNSPSSTQSDLMNSSYGAPLSMQNTSSVDIPPELGEIKNLNEATVASAPTMDVLDPMNVIKPTSNQPQDRLDAYESGNLNIPNQPIGSVPNQGYFPEQQFVNQTQNYGSNQQFINPAQNYGFNQPFVNQPQDYNGTQPLASSSFGAPINQMPSNQFNYMNQPSFVNQSNDSFNGINPGYNTFQPTPQTNNFPPLNEIPSFEPASDLKQANVQNEASTFPLENQSDQLQNESEEMPNLNTDINSDENVLSDKKSEESLGSDYTIVQDDKLNEDKNESKDLSDLGIENAYDEPDMLDIMDITDDESSDSDNVKNISYNESLDQIKKLINDLKSKGAKIDLEEFDFEQMYQLIVKINK